MADDQGSTSPFSFILGGVLIVAALATVVLSTDDIGRDHQSGEAETEERRAQAEGLAALLLDSPGYRTNGAAWIPPAGSFGSHAQADSLQRLGLLDANTGYLNLTKFENLRLAPYFADGADGYVNYEEARGQLGLDDQYLNFHVRVYPTLVEVQEKLREGLRDENLKVTYLGDIDGTSNGAPTWDDPECDVSPYDDNYHRVSIRIPNDGGTQTQFDVSLSIDEGPGADVVHSDVSPITAAGDDAWVHIDFPDTDNVDCEDGTEFLVTVSDISAALDSQTYDTFTRLGTPTEDNDGFTAELDRQHYVAGDTATVRYGGASEGDTISWKLLEADDPVAAVVSPIADHSGSFSAAKKAQDQFFTFTVPSTASDTVSYRLVVENEDEDQTHTILLALRKDTSITLDNYAPGTASASSAMVAEIGFLEDLVQNFCPANYDDAGTTWLDPADVTDADGNTISLADRCADRTIPAWQGGDVFWDDKDVVAALCERLVKGTSPDDCPNSNFQGTLKWTNLLVVGSHVDHNSMTKGTFKWPLKAWVEAGGTVVAFGSPSTTTEWLQPIFNVGHKTSSGGLSTPDTSHPLLTRPNQLDYTGYDNAGEGWRFKTNANAANFTHVVKQGDDPITSISNPGAFGRGSVLISTWLPYDPYGNGDSIDQGQAIMDNFITQAYRDLFLDYGPPIPSDQEVVPAFRRAQIDHDKLGLVDLDIAVFVFPGA